MFENLEIIDPQENQPDTFRAWPWSVSVISSTKRPGPSLWCCLAGIVALRPVVSPWGVNGTISSALSIFVSCLRGQYVCTRPRKMYAIVFLENHQGNLVKKLRVHAVPKKNGVIPWEGVGKYFRLLTAGRE